MSYQAALLNDQALAEQIARILRRSVLIDHLCANGIVNGECGLFHVLDHIEDAARKAKWRLNELKFQERSPECAAQSPLPALSP